MQDEEFHFDLTKQWCEHGIEGWNSKISTGPGLYYYTVALCNTLKMLLGKDFNVCTLITFRFFILPLSLGSIFLYRKIALRVITADSSVAFWISLKVWSFPILFFFQFLYYNEIPSIFFLAWMHLSTLEKKYWKTSIVSGLIIVIYLKTYLSILYSLL